MDEPRNIIYALIDPDSKEIRYIGKSSTGMSRPREHFKRTELNKDSYKSRWVRGLIRNGKIPAIIVLCVAECAEALYALEQECIAQHRAMGCRLTNLTDGGEGTLGYKHREDTKRLLSMLKKGKPGTKGIPSPFKGIKRGKPTDEHVANMREAQKQVAQRPEERKRRIDMLAAVQIKKRKPVACSNGIIYESVAAAAKELCLHKPNVFAVLSGRYKQAGGYTFKYADGAELLDAEGIVMDGKEFLKTLP